MGYCDYLKTLLSPLGLYDLEQGAGGAELVAVGAQMDELYAFLQELSNECLALWADGYGLELYQRLLPERPAYITVSDARQAVAALLQIRGGCFTPDALQRTVYGCGIMAVITESEEPQTVIISFPQNRGVPRGIDRVKRRLEQILPCHLAVEYYYIYTLWGELMELLGSWRELSRRQLTWRQAEILDS